MKMINGHCLLRKYSYLSLVCFSKNTFFLYLQDLKEDILATKRATFTDEISEVSSYTIMQ